MESNSIALPFGDSPIIIISIFNCLIMDIISRNALKLLDFTGFNMYNNHAAILLYSQIRPFWSESCVLCLFEKSPDTLWCANTVLGSFLLCITDKIYNRTLVRFCQYQILF